MKALFALAFLVCVSVAFGLKCYKCSSRDSMAACDDDSEVVTCSFLLTDPRCFKESLKYKAIVTFESYSKGCTTGALCDAEPGLRTCEALDGDICKQDCCDGDLCNSGGAPAVSVHLMVACALGVLYR